MGAAYSSLGRTKVLYATSFVLLGAKVRDSYTKVFYFQILYLKKPFYLYCFTPKNHSFIAHDFFLPNFYPYILCLLFVEGQ